MEEETIFALATPDGRSGVALIRISGPLANKTVENLAGKSFEPRFATLAWLKDPVSGDRIDQVLVLYFPGPGSFTGEDVVEIQCHGSRAVTKSLLSILTRQTGLREAEPGEFTRRSLINGRMDLSQVEGLGDLLSAETEAQRRLAVSLVDGQLTAKANSWRDQLINTLAMIEVTIDFADEEIPEPTVTELDRNLSALVADMESEISGSKIAERMRGGFEVAVVGAPNVGKSTLLNSIAGRDAALTSEYAGTTRDIIEVHMDLNGIPITILDTAGIRSASDPVEHQGVKRAVSRAESSDLRIFLVEEDGDERRLGIDVGADDIVLLNKADLRPADRLDLVSGATGLGVESLLGRVSEVFGKKISTMGLVSHERQRSSIIKCIADIQSGLLVLKNEPEQVDFVFAHLSDAVSQLEFLAGKTDIEHILDSVFQNFCLGK